MKWYAIFVKSGMEELVLSYLDLMLNGKLKLHAQLLVPKRELIEYSRGTKKSTIRILYPGYVFMRINEIYSAYFLIKERWHSAIYKFLRNDDYFYEISENEIGQMIQMLDEKGIIRISNICVEKNRILALDGPLTLYNGKIIKINTRKGRAKIQLELHNESRTVDIGINCCSEIKDHKILKIIEF